MSQASNAPPLPETPIRIGVSACLMGQEVRFDASHKRESFVADTLGSLWAGGLSLLQQTGLALASGILIDTFFVRPILIPSFFLATKRRRRRRHSGALRDFAG